MRFFLLCALLSFAACSPQLEDQKIIELVRLNYKQQNTVAGAGTWLLDTVEIANKERLAGDTTRYKVIVYTRGLFRFPEIEDMAEGFMEKFHDTLQFEAEPMGKIWKAKRWIVLGSVHE